MRSWPRFSRFEAGVRVRIKATDSDGDVYYAYPSDDADPDLQDDPEGVTYCYRFQQIEAKFGGLNCTADLDPDNDIVNGTVTCADPEHLRLLLRTLSAHSFNFMLGVDADVYTTEVQARAQGRRSRVRHRARLGAGRGVRRPRFAADRGNPSRGWWSRRELLMLLLA